MLILKKYENNYIKITVEETKRGRFITTFWLKSMNSEVDRDIYEFETYGGAVGKAFDLLTESL